MPIYEYQCRQCHRVEEVLQKFSDKPLSKCRHCSGKMDKLISQSAFHLKGSGWYVTDYAKKGASEPTKSASKKKSAASDSGVANKSTPKSPSAASE